MIKIIEDLHVVICVCLWLCVCVCVGSVCTPQTLPQVVPRTLLSFPRGWRHSTTHYERLFLSLIPAANWHHNMLLSHKSWNVSKDLFANTSAVGLTTSADAYFPILFLFFPSLFSPFVVEFLSDISVFPSAFCYRIPSRHALSVSASLLS